MQQVSKVPSHPAKKMAIAGCHPAKLSYPHPWVLRGHQEFSGQVPLSNAGRAPVLGCQDLRCICLRPSNVQKWGPDI